MAVIAHCPDHVCTGFAEVHSGRSLAGEIGALRLDRRGHRLERDASRTAIVQPRDGETGLVRILGEDLVLGRGTRLPVARWQTGYRQRDFLGVGLITLSSRYAPRFTWPRIPIVARHDGESESLRQRDRNCIASDDRD